MFLKSDLFIFFGSESVRLLLASTTSELRSHRRMGRGGRGARAPPVRPETLISRAIST